VYRIKKKPGIRAGYGKELMERISMVEMQLESHSDSIQALSRQVASKAVKSPTMAKWTAESASDLPQITQEAPGLDLTSIPGPVVLRELISLYFHRIHPSFPILHPQNTVSMLQAAISSREPYPLLLYAMVAVTLRFTPQFLLSEKDKARYYKNCKEIVMLRSFAITDIDCLQALFVLAIDLVGISNGPETWSVIPLICSAAIHLGLARENDAIYNLSANPKAKNDISSQSADILPGAETWIEQEARRRLLWGIYTLDRFSSVATAFSFKLNSLEIDRMLPVRQDLWTDPANQSLSAYGNRMPLTRWLKTPVRTDYSMDHPENIDAFGYMLEALQILSSIHEFLKTPVNIYALQDVLDWQVKFRRLNLELESWYQSIPKHIKDMGDKTQLDPMLVMLHSTYQTTVIRLNSAAGYCALKSEFFTPSQSAAKKCLAAVDSVVSLAKHVVVFGTWQYLGPHYAWALWVSARLLVVDCVINHKSFPDDLDLLMTGLRKLGKTWAVAARYYRMLIMVIDEELSLRTRGSANGDILQATGNGKQLDDMGGRQVSSVEILSDMRRNAYALDFLLSKTLSPVTSSPVNDTNEANFQIGKYQQPMEYQQQLSKPAVPQFELSSMMEDSNNDIFEWFNWPKQPPQLGGMAITQQHSVDEYKNILSRDRLDVNDPEATDMVDWLSKQD
jgi:hypothetical protein